MAMIASLATSNWHKLQEVQALFGDVVELFAWDAEVAETGSTFEDNALIKARAGAQATGRFTFADDSGIEVAALGGAPGIHSARWVAESRWITEVQERLRTAGAVTAVDRQARYVCAAAAVRPDGREFVTRGVVEGRIATTAQGTGGFGYDSIMIPNEGDGRTFAEMSPVEKRALSHRSRAFRALAAELRLPRLPDIA